MLLITCNTHVVSQHQSSGLDDKLVGLLVSDHSSSQTCSTAGFAAGIHCSGTELLHMPVHITVSPLQCQNNGHLP